MDNQDKLTMTHLMSDGSPPPGAACLGMLVSAVLLRSDGMRVASDVRKATPPIIGRLVLDDFPRGKGIALVCRSQAQLFAASGSSMPYSLRKPLFDPEIVHWDSRGIVIRGYELDMKNGLSIEYAQVWMVTPLTQ